MSIEGYGVYQMNWLMLHKTDETDFDAGTSEIWENCLNFPKFQMSLRQNLFRQFYAALAIEANLICF